MAWFNRSLRMALLAACGFAATSQAVAQTCREAIGGAVTVPIVSGRPEMQPLAVHPGWIDVYSSGDATGVSARVGPDGRFSIPGTKGPVSVIVTFDRMELPPIIVADWKETPGGLTGRDVPIAAEYAVLPPGDPEKWEKELAVSYRDFWRTFVPRSRHLHACMVCDGKKIVDWGNKVNVTMHRDGVNGPLMEYDISGGGSYLSAAHTDFEFPAVGWRYGDMSLEPGKTYYVEIKSSEPLMMFADGDFYTNGHAYYDGRKVEQTKGLQHGDQRYMLVMDIITYANADGRAETPTPGR